MRYLIIALCALWLSVAQAADCLPLRPIAARADPGYVVTYGPANVCLAILEEERGGARLVRIAWEQQSRAERAVLVAHDSSDVLLWVTTFLTFGQQQPWSVTTALDVTAHTLIVREQDASGAGAAWEYLLPWLGTDPFIPRLYVPLVVR
jgi:hypothetical protein